MRICNAIIHAWRKWFSQNVYGSKNPHIGIRDELDRLFRGKMVKVIFKEREDEKTTEMLVGICNDICSLTPFGKFSCFEFEIDHQLFSFELLAIGDDFVRGNYKNGLLTICIPKEKEV